MTTKRFFFVIVICLSEISSFSQSIDKNQRRFTYSFSTPIVNNYRISTPDSIINNTSFLGLTLGVGYYYNNRNYFDLRIGGTISNEVPIPVGVDHVGGYETYSSTFIDFTTNHVITNVLKNRIHCFGGINYTRYSFSNRYTASLFPNYVDTTVYSDSRNTLGLTAGFKFRIFNHWLVGFKANSSVYNFDTNSFEYNHIMYVDFIFRFWSRRD